MSFYEKNIEENSTTTSEEINKIESEIFTTVNNVRKEIKIIEPKIKDLNNFQKVKESDSIAFVGSFGSDIKGIENSVNFLLEYKDKFMDLYNKKYGDYPENSIDDKKNDNSNDCEDEKADLLEIKERVGEARTNILKVFPDLIRSLNALGDGKDLQRGFMESNINELRSIEDNMERLSHCKEMISEFCE